MKTAVKWLESILITAALDAHVVMLVLLQVFGATK